MERVEPGDTRPYDHRVELFLGHRDSPLGIKLTIGGLLKTSPDDIVIDPSLAIRVQACRAPSGAIHPTRCRWSSQHLGLELEAVCIDLVLYCPQLPESGTQVVTTPAI